MCVKKVLIAVNFLSDVSLKIWQSVLLFQQLLVPLKYTSLKIVT